MFLTRLLVYCQAFPEPLRGVVLQLAEAWDEQKRLLSHAQRAARPGGGRIDFVVVPAAVDAGRSIVCVDGVHPNEHGYGIWADHIAENLSLLLRETGARPPAAAPVAVSPWAKCEVGRTTP